jgi:hypothetical protein
VSCALLFSGGAATAETVRRGFQNWLAVMEEDGTRYCIPRGHLRSSRKMPDFQLRVVRGENGGLCRIVLISAFAFVDPDREILVRVDGDPGLRLNGRIADAGGKRGKTYAVTDGSTVHTLLRRIRAGAWIRFDYHDPAGQRSSAVFSLMGASAALDAIQCRLPGP